MRESSTIQAFIGVKKVTRGEKGDSHQIDKAGVSW